MNKQKVEFEFEPMKVLGALATISAILAAGYAIASWIDDAEESHETVEAMPSPPIIQQQTETEDALETLAKGQLQLQQQEMLRQEIWGPNYRKKISEILDEEEQPRNETGSE